MNYNVYLRVNHNDDFILAIDEVELERIIDAYESGLPDLMLPGRDKIVFTRIEKLTIYECEKFEHEDDVKAYLNHTSTSSFGPVQFWKESQLKVIGKNVTKDFVTTGYGERVEAPVPFESTTFHILEKVYFHPEVIRNGGKFFENEHYKEAVQEVAVGLVSRVRAIYRGKTGKDLDGKPLMMACFSEENPIIQLFGNDVNDWRGIQEGYKFIFAGVVLALRNPKAHGNFSIDKLEAIESLFLCSRLHKTLDNAVDEQKDREFMYKNESIA